METNLRTRVAGAVIRAIVSGVIAAIVWLLIFSFSYHTDASPFKVPFWDGYTGILVWIEAAVLPLSLLSGLYSTPRKSSELKRKREL